MSKKDVVFLTIISIFVLLLTACGSGSSASGEEVYELNLNVSAAPTSAFTIEVAEPWAEMVEEETDGRVKVNLFPSAALGSLETAYDDINNGVYEAGLVSPGRHIDTELFPLSVGDIPFTITSPEVAEEVLTQFVNDHLLDVFDDATFMGISSTDAWNLYSKEPVVTVEDLKGFRINEAASERLALINTWGATGVTLSNTDIYEGLERGTIDKAFYTTVGANGYSMHEVAPYLTKLDIGASTLMFMINNSFLDRLPDDLKTLLIEDLGPQYTVMMKEMYTAEAEAALEEFKQFTDEANVIEPSEEDLEEFRAPVVELAEEWIEKANDRGYDGQALLDYYSGKLQEAGVTVPY